MWFQIFMITVTERLSALIFANPEGVRVKIGYLFFDRMATDLPFHLLKGVMR